MTSWIKAKLPAAFLILCLASFVVFLEVEASEDSDELIGPAAVWNPTANQLGEIDQRCRVAGGQDYSRCFISQMSALGASPESVAFTRSYAEQSHGMIAFLQGFYPVDAVDVGYAFFPASADFNQRWFLLNGNPPIIDVDDLRLLPQADLAGSPAFAALRQRYPKVALFDGDRGFNTLPAMETLTDGSQEFVINYPLKDQCRACAVVGSTRFAFEFDPAGQMTRVKFVDATPADK